MTLLRTKWKIVVPALVLVVAGAAYKTVLAPPPSDAHNKVKGTVYVLPKEFLVNLRGGRFAKLTLGLVLSNDTIPAGTGESSSGPPLPDGFGPLPEEALVRDLVTNTLTDASAGDLITGAGRERLKRRLLMSIRKNTDVPVSGVLLTDVAVQ